MKKVLITIICLFSFIEISLANNKYDSKMYVKYDGKTTNKIDIKDKKEFTIDVYFEAKDFDMYATVFELEYDKDSLELINSEAFNNFEVITDNKILADRIEIPEKDDHKVLSLTFKVKKDTNKKITFKKINVANVKEQFEINDVVIKTSDLNNKMIISVVMGAIVLSGTAAFIIKKKKNN